MIMPYRVIPCPFYLAKSIFGEQTLETIGSGNINTSFVLGDWVYQFGLGISKNTPSCFREIVNKWIPLKTAVKYDAKSALLFEMEDYANRIAKKCHNSSWSIQTPTIRKTKNSYVNHENDTFPFWKIQKVNGMHLNSWLEGSENSIPDLFQSILFFLHEFHQNEKDLFQIDSEYIRNWYIHRLIAYQECFEIIKAGPWAKIMPDSLFTHIFDHLDYLSSLLPVVTKEFEKISPIHGDLRSENVLINADEKKIWIIDFEQGLDGGDWATDIFKLLRPSYNYFSLADPNEKPYIYIPPVKENFKLDLISVYLEDRLPFLSNKILLGKEKRSVLDGRMYLVQFDVVASILILRILMEHNFEQNIDKSEHSRRGVIYLTRKLLKHMKLTHDNITLNFE